MKQIFPLLSILALMTVVTAGSAQAQIQPTLGPIKRAVNTCAPFTSYQDCMNQGTMPPGWCNAHCPHRP